MRKLFIAGLLLLAAVSLMAQQNVLQWKANNEAYAFPFTFDGAYTIREMGELPLVQMQGNDRLYEYTITDAVWEALPPSSLADDWKQYIPEELWIKNELIQIREKSSVISSLLPLRKTSDGSIERLISFRWKKGELMTPPSLKSKYTYASQSVLQSGEWYKVSVPASGVYKITSAQLTEMGIDISKIDPRKIGMYSMGGGSIPEKNADVKMDDLPPIAIEVYGEEDGKMDAGDYVLFYGQGPVRWKFNPAKSKFDHLQNHYSDVTYYYLNVTDDNPKRISKETLSVLPESARVNTYLSLYLHENDSLCPTKTGKVWLGEVFESSDSKIFTFNAPDFVNTSDVHLDISVAGRASQENRFWVKYQNEQLLQINFSGILPGSMDKYYARPVKAYKTFKINSEGIKLDLSYEWPNITSIAWLDYLALNVPRYLTYRGGQMPFNYVPPSSGNHLPEITLSGNAANARIWRVDDQANVKNIEASPLGNKKVFKMIANGPMDFIAFENTDAPAPTFVEKVSNQNLHAMDAADMIIICPEMFRPQAERLAALHLMHDGITTVIASPEKIYNEFSCGVRDPGGIRSFIRMLYQKASPEQQLRYVLLFGEGSYDPKDRIPNNNNLIPAFQSDEGLTVVNSFVCDDFYGLMDDNEGVDGSGGIDLGIGRFPVSTTEQANLMLEKAEAYIAQNGLALADWRNSICFVADDEDNNTHFEQAEGLSFIVDTSDVNLNVNKIFLDAYRQTSTTSGHIYQGAAEDLKTQVENGALIINYTGHGGILGWSGEAVLTIPDILGWRNNGRLPVFVTATCAFSRFDDPSLVSAGELVLVNGHHGGAALFTTTRLAYSSTNNYLNRAFYKSMFTTINGEKPRMGDLVRLSKNIVNNNDKIRNFVLLGDPALALAFPAHSLIITHVNGKAVENGMDTLNAMEKVTFKGKVCTRSGELLSGFTGQMDWKMYDKKDKLKTLGNDPGSHIQEFTLRQKIISQGRTKVNNGYFEFSMIIPRDINLSFGEGKLSLYATDTITDAAGGFTKFILGGATTAILDEQGPDITMYLNGPGFKNGLTVAPDATFFALLNDSSGINFSGLGIGHHISLSISDAPAYSEVNLNPYFEAYIDDYTGGIIRFPLHNLPEGPHTLTLRVWDINNNSSQKSIDFVVSSRYNIDLYEVKTNPNPFTDKTWFSFRHNKAGVALDVEIAIYNLQGTLVNVLKESFKPSGYTIPPIQWDGKNINGLTVAPGIYIYQIRVNSKDGSRGETASKLLKLN